MRVVCDSIIQFSDCNLVSAYYNQSAPTDSRLEETTSGYRHRYPVMMLPQCYCEYAEAVGVLYLTRAGCWWVFGTSGDMDLVTRESGPVFLL